MNNENKEPRDKKKKFVNVKRNFDDEKNSCCEMTFVMIIWKRKCEKKPTTNIDKVNDDDATIVFDLSQLQNSHYYNL